MNHVEPISLAECMKQLGYPLDDVPTEVRLDEHVNDLEQEIAHLAGVNVRLRHALSAAAQELHERDLEIKRLHQAADELRFDSAVTTPTSRRAYAISRLARHPHPEGA